MENQSLLEALLRLSLVVVPMARCFSRDSYGGSVMTRSTDALAMQRSHSTASIENKEKLVLGGLSVGRRVAFSEFIGFQGSEARAR
jgi:hypothetical protein